MPPDCSDTKIAVDDQRSVGQRRSWAPNNANKEASQKNASTREAQHIQRCHPMSVGVLPLPRMAESARLVGFEIEAALPETSPR